MKIRKKQLCAALATAMGAGMTLSLVAGHAQAQQSAQTRERIEITGSNIKRVDQEGPNPVAVIRREDMERSAGQNLSEILTNLSVANLGSFTETRQSGNSFAPGTAAISLRGLGPQTTLVLVNGRRLANYGFAQNINEAFVDLNSIPVSAIERIEILKAGASAIYGSDAIAGVVNIILRKDFRGVEATVGAGTSSRHDADETRANLTAGFGDIHTQRFNIMGTLDYYKRDPLFGDARAQSATADYRRFLGGIDFRSPSGSPGTWLTAGNAVPAAQRLPTNTVFPSCSAEAREQALDPLGTCAYNFAPDVMILPETERKGVFTRGVFEFSPTLSAFAEASWNKNDSFTQLAPTPDAFTLPVGHNSNPFPFPVGIRYRFVDVGPRISNQVSETTRYVLGLKGAFRNWDWEAAYVDAHNEIVENRANFIATPVRNALVTANIYSFVNPQNNDPALAASLRATPQRNGDSKMQSYDAKLSGTLMELPAGPLGLAVGAEHRKESVRDVPDPLGAQGLIIGSGGTAADGGRTSSGFFGELSIPFTRTLEGQIALRHERYSDYGNSTVPKYALAWRATPNVLLRAGYDEGFRAPALAELYLGQSTSFLSVVDSTRCAGYRTAFGNSDPRTAAACAALQYRSIVGGNPDLTAEKSKSETLGVIWDITPRLSASLDYYRITHEQRIATPSVNFLVGNEDLFPGGVTRDPQTANDVIAGTRGPIVGSGSDDRVGLRQFYFNASSQATRGVDVEVRYRTPIGSWGNLALSSINTYVEYFRRSVAPGQLPIELAGNDRFPRYRGVHTAVWSRGPWDASLTINSIGSYNQPLQPIPGVILRVASWNTADIQASWSGIKWVKVTAGVRNVLDRDPPFYNNESSGGYDTFSHNILGRFYYGRLTVSFR